MSVRPLKRDMADLVDEDLGGNSIDYLTAATSRHEVAIVGTACQVAGASTPQELVEFCAQRRCASRPVPTSRWKTENYYHPESSKAGHYNVQGGSFLDRDIAAFDAPFFNLGVAEAQAMDPQERVMLETAYLAIEDAGIPLRDLSGRRDVGVFAGGSKSEYDNMIQQDRFTMPRYAASGNAMCMFANRLSYFLGVGGPSMTVDTACSSSLTALDAAVESIRSERCRVAIVGGSFLQLSPLGMAGMGALGTLAPGGKSLAFDVSGDGYGRGDGSACIVIVSRSHAVSAGYQQRAIIKGTGINHCGRSQGITMPDRLSQIDLIEQTYARAGLDPLDTAVVEAHGTGTERGDDIEMRAIAEAFQVSRRTAHRPLWVGSIKTNFGHCEGASGIVSVVKCVAMLEEHRILPNANFDQPNDALARYVSKIKVPTECIEWPTYGLRRISINNFGFGGSNAHVILEAGPEARRETCPLAAFDRPPKDRQSYARLFLLSARDQSTLKLQMAAFARYLENKPRNAVGEHAYMDDLAYTLTHRRTLFDWRAAFTAPSVADLKHALQTPSNIEQCGGKVGPLFVFTGQGSAWAGMAVDLLHLPPFADTLRQAEAVLRRLGASWSLIDELRVPIKESRVETARIAQPAITAIQMALVCLLQTWEIVPHAVTGHSSGEIAAAYAAGYLTFEAALAIAYFRGCGVADLGESGKANLGAMLAVGASPEDMEPLVQSLFDGVAQVACYNSPASVTVSGDEAAIGELQRLLNERGQFNRRLNVDQAYHSGHMLPLVEPYVHAIRPYLQGQVQEDGRESGVRFISSVFGREIPTRHLTSPWYWATNLASPVRFAAAARQMFDTCISQDRGLVPVVEIGPHKALATPIRTIMNSAALSGRLRYHATMQRGGFQMDHLLNLAANLTVQGVPVNLTQVVERSAGGERPFTYVSDIPRYSFNLARRYWHESRFADGPAKIGSQWNALLGHRQDHIPGVILQCRNVFTLNDIPWLRDHVINGAIVFPLAGYICSVVEALNLYMTECSLTAQSFFLRRMIVHKALVLQEAKSHDLYTTLLPDTVNGDDHASRDTIKFRISSWIPSIGFTDHCSGTATIAFDEKDDSISQSLHQESLAKQLMHVKATARDRVSPEHLYNMSRRCGLQYGPSFALVSSLQTGCLGAVGTVQAVETSASMPAAYEGRLLLHPTVLDAAFHVGLCHLAGNTGDPAAMRAHMPTAFESIRLSAHLRHDQMNNVEVCSYGAYNAPGSRQTSQDMVIRIPGSCEYVVEIEKMDLIDVNQDNVGMSVADRVNPQRIVWTTHHLLSDTATPATEIITSVADQVQVLTDASLWYLQHAVAAKPPMLSSEPPHIRMMLDWMNRTLENNHKVRDLPTGFSQLCQTIVDAELIKHAGNGLADVLYHGREPLEVLTQDECLFRCYEDSMIFRDARQTITRLIAEMALENPSMNMIEIGAGTGGFTSGVLDAITSDSGSPRFHHYTFTDLSPGFFPKAREKLSKWQANMTFRRLDVSADDLRDQGFENGSYDLVIAALVLHATPNVEDSLSNIRALLKPGGRVVVVELSAFPPVVFPFAMLPGWWAQGSRGPWYSRHEWAALVKKAGYDDLHAYWEDQCGNCVFWTQPHFQSCSSIGDFRIGLFARDVHDFRMVHTSKVLRQNPPAAATSVAMHGMGHAIKGFDFIICFADSEHLSLTTSTPQRFRDVQALIQSASHILWVTTEDEKDARKCLDAFALGFGRVLRNENSSKRFMVLQTDIFDKDTTPVCIGKILRYARSRGLNHGALDVEFRQAGGHVLVPRMLPDTQAYRALRALTKPRDSELTRFAQEENVVSVQCAHPGQLSSVDFHVDVAPYAPLALAEDEVEIQVMAMGLNFKDLLIALGRVPFEGLGKECAGVVVAAGTAASNTYRCGARVVHWGDGLFASRKRCRTTTLAPIPANVSDQAAASVPIVFATAYESLVTRANVQPGESVLIHAASGGVGQAAIILCKWLRAEIFCTVGSLEKKALVSSQYGIPENRIFSSRSPSFARHLLAATDRRGIDVVLSSLAGDMVKASWDCMAIGGRFIDVGKRDALEQRNLGMGPFARGASYSAVDLSLLITHKPFEAQRLLHKVMSLMHDKIIYPVHPITTMPVTSIQDAFRLMQAGKHVGKLVLTADTSTVVRAVTVQRDAALFSKGSYIITGGTGGLGRAIVEWMINRGVKRVVLLSRSGADALQTTKWSKTRANASDRGADIIALACDVSDLADVRKAVALASTISPVRGVVHGAMILKDALYESSNAENWAAVIQPKIEGALNLHCALENTRLDFFICLSSASSVGMALGQSSYAGSNAVLDSFCKWRAEQGLAASSLGLSAITDAGYVAEMGEGGQDWTGRSMTSKEVTALIEVSLDEAVFNPSSNSNHVIAGLQSHSEVLKEVQGRDPLWAVFAHDLAHKLGHAAGSRGDDPSATISAQTLLSAADDFSQALAIINAALLSQVASTMSIPREDIGPDTCITDLGVDSLVAVELRNWMSKELHTSLSVLDIIGSPSLAALSEQIASSSSLVKHAI